MKIYQTFLGLFLSSLSLFNFNNAAQVVGHTKINLTVGENGEARASIPINLPKGTILQPSLNIAYNSQGANGLLGNGWSLNGIFQTITRMPATMAQDGFIDGVDFDNNDRFALNGERLIVISGNYGANLSSYQTEQSNFSRVISYGDTGNGPQYFKVWTKDGLIMEFGSESDSRIGVANASGKIMIWLLNKITDTNGNYININYHNGVNNGEYRPTSIEYTGNQNLGKAPYNRVEFYYETRPDIFTRYMAGQHSIFTQRLKNIVIYDHNTFFRRYELEYLNGVGVSKLHKVTEFGSDNSSTFKSIIINWITNTTGAYDFNKSGTGFWQGHGGGEENNVLGDFNGDGRTDMAGYAGNGQWHVSLATGSGFTSSFWQGHGGGIDNNIAADFNGDGRTDLAGHAGNGQWHVSLSTGSGFSSSFWQGHGGGVTNNVLGDFNGDGRTDMAGYSGDGVWHVALSTGSNFTGGFWNGHTGGADNNVSGDFNGDGRTDLAGYAGNGQWHIALSTGSGFTAGGFWAGHSGGADNNVAGDFNKDGLTDIAGYAGNGQWHVNLSTGTKFEGGFWAGHGGGTDNNIIGDFNGDGRTDLAGYSGDGQWHVTLSTGKGFVGSYWDGHSGGADNNFVGDFNGDGFTDILGHSTGGQWHVALSNAKKELVTNIVHGNDLVSVFEHLPITNTSLYTKGANASYPLMNISGAMYVVSVFSTNDGIGGRRRREYQYFDAKYDHTGRGFRGFEKISMIDYAANSHVTTTYDRDYRHIAAKVKTVTYKTLDGRLIKAIDNTPEAISLYNGVFYSYYKKKIERNYKLSGGLFNTKTTDLFHDRHGNTIRIAEDFNGAYTVETKNTFVNDENKWHLGRLTQAIVEKTHAGQSILSKKSTFQYDNNGNLVKEILLPDHATRRLETNYTLDGFGNRITTTQSGPGITTRSDYYTYDSNGRHIIQEKNALNHTVNHTYELGYLKTSTDPNGLKTTYTRDVFGRDFRTDYPDGTWETVSYNQCSSCPSGAIYFLENRATGTGYSRTYLDKLDRTIKTVSEGFDGTLINQDIKFNADGTTQSTSDPYHTGQTVYSTTFEYDDLKRITKETRPSNEITTFNYNGFETKVTNSENQTFTRLMNPMGKVIRTIDHLGSNLSFFYDNDLNLITRMDQFENTINYAYDIRGFKVAMNDPSMGGYTYEYNTLGQLTKQTYPGGKIVTFEYDILNRVTKRTEEEGVTQWEYDPTNGTGNVKSVSVGGMVAESYTYNTDGKLQSKTYVRDNQNKTFSYAYNNNGFIDSETYPNGYKLKYSYNSRGFPTQVIEDGTNKVLWEANQYDENGRNMQFTLGNGLKTTKTYNDITEDLQRITTGPSHALSSIQDLQYTFSKLGNLQQRKDVNLNLIENFEFDDLNRLTKSTVEGQTPLEIQYDLLGNIAFKSDVGDYNYGEGGKGPHTLTSISHDRVPGCVYNLQQNVGFTSYNYVTSISNQNTRVEINYGPERDRTQLRTYKDGQLKATKTYVGNTYEEIETIDGALTQICYLKIGSEVFAYTSKKDDNPQIITYIHTDHIGSVNVLTDEQGSFIERHSFDAWGKQRNAFTWENLENPPVVPAHFAKGFTFHEMLDVDWLVCMNARVYNPVLGRFLSPDPFIQHGENMQNMNRFVYVLNNPLSFTDPTGYFSLSEFFEDTFDFVKENAGTIISIAISVATGGAGGFFATLIGDAFLGAVLSGAAAGFGGAFTDALLAGSSISDAFSMGLDGGLWGAVSAGITNQIGGLFSAEALSSNKGLYAVKAVIHGVAQGGISEARGGDFRSGFIGAAVAELGIDAADGLGAGNNVIVGAVVGGTASHLSGGKFANGALSGAFIAIYNHGGAHEYENDSGFDGGDVAQMLLTDIAIAGVMSLTGIGAVYAVPYLVLKWGHRIHKGTKYIKPLTKQAEKLVELNGGKNSITLSTSSKKIRYDLAGKSHGGVPTPHKQIYNRNFHNGVQRSVTRASKQVTPMNQQEIRMIRKYLERQ